MNGCSKDDEMFAIEWHPVVNFDSTTYTYRPWFTLGIAVLTHIKGIAVIVWSCGVHEVMYLCFDDTLQRLTTKSSLSQAQG